MQSDEFKKSVKASSKKFVVSEEDQQTQHEHDPQPEPQTLSSIGQQFPNAQENAQGNS